MAILQTPRLRSVFVAVNLVILLLPLGGVVLLRLYESALVRRTESELIVQAAIVAATYQQELARVVESSSARPDDYGRPLELTELAVAGRSGRLRHRLARLSLAVDPVLPIPRDNRPPARPASPSAVTAGERLTRVLRDAKEVTLTGVRVVDERGVVVASSGGDLGLSMASREEIRRAFSGEEVSLMRERVSDEAPPALDSLSRTTHLRVYVSTPIIDRDRLLGAVLLSRTPMSVPQSLYGIRWHIAGWGVALLGAVVLVSVFTSYTVTRPVAALIRQTEQVAAGVRSAAIPLAKPGTHEVDQLSKAFAAMAQTLETRSDYIRSFASSVSHEFKTPLTSIRGTAELLRDHVDEMTVEERDRFLANLDDDAERLQRLTGRLLELARADVVHPDGESADLTAILTRLVERYRDAGMSLALDVAPDVPAVRIAGESLERIFTNLFDNATRHGGTAVKVTVAVTDLTEGVRVVIVDDGPGITEANVKRVFDPFFTTARDTGGTGLGLSIVRSLVDAHGGSIELASQPGETRLEIRFLPVSDRTGDERAS